MGRASCRVHLVKSDVEMFDRSIIKVSPYEAHPEKCVPAKLATFMERILVQACEEEPAQPRWKVGWLLGMVGPDAEVLEPDRNHRRYGNWRHSPDPETEQKKGEMKKAQKEIKEPNFNTASCST